MKHKVVLVTGSQRGIGAATIKEFASIGYDVVIDYIEQEDKARKLKEYVENSHPVKALTIYADVRKEEDVEKMVNEILEKFGRIDVLVNNAGIAIDKDFEDRNLDDWKNTLATNLVGPYIVSKRVGKEMLKNKQGKIINVSSANGINAFFPTSLDYDASKAGLINLTHNLALQYAPYINVNAVAPGWVNTDMNKDLPEDLVAEEVEKIYLKRFAEPEEIAKIIRFLASDDAAYINGEIIKVDGGY